MLRIIDRSKTQSFGGSRGGNKRPTIPLQEKPEKRLRAYLMAAGAAGVGVLALAQPASADIVYYPGSSALNSSGQLSMGGQTFIGFTVSNPPTPFGTNLQVLRISAIGPSSTKSGWVGHPSILGRGALIGPGDEFFDGAQTIAADWQICSSGGCRSGSYGWANKKGYLGLEFTISGEVHYGWADLSVSGARGSVGLELNGAAYDTVPGQAILAGQTAVPEPGTLGLLALGSLGLGCWRRRKAVSTQQ